VLYVEYGDRIHFIIIYIIEAHPIGSPSPYSGREWPSSASTDTEDNPRTQPMTYQERVYVASEMIQEIGITVPVLIDEIDNRVWCTYGPAPDIAYLIDRDGIIVEKQGWYQPDLMETVIDKYLNSEQS